MTSQWPIVRSPEEVQAAKTEFVYAICPKCGTGTKSLPPNAMQIVTKGCLGCTDDWEPVIKVEPTMTFPFYKVARVDEAQAVGVPPCRSCEVRQCSECGAAVYLTLAAWEKAGKPPLVCGPCLDRIVKDTGASVQEVDG